MKKVIFVICIIVFFCFSIFDNDEQIRIRIIANSNSVYDQEVKKNVVQYLYENYNLEFESFAECDNYLESNINEIKADLKSKFNDVEVSYTTHKFYNKSYNNIVSENEVYKTLLIEIKEAQGENFWGVLYSKNFVENENTITYNSYLLELFKKGE